MGNVVSGTQGIIMLTPYPLLSIVDNSFLEDLPFRFVLELSASSAQNMNMNVYYCTNDETATTSEDYIPVSVTVPFKITITAGETTVRVMLQVISDTIPKSDETFSINLIKATKAAIADSESQITIIDDELGW